MDIVKKSPPNTTKFSLQNTVIEVTRIYYQQCSMNYRTVLRTEAPTTRNSMTCFEFENGTVQYVSKYDVLNTQVCTTSE